MQIIAPPKVSPETIAAFFAAVRLWLLEAVTPFVLYACARSPHAGALRARLDAEVRDAIRATREMLFAMAVARMTPHRLRRVARGGARPGTSPVGFRPAPRSRNWLRLAARVGKARGLTARLALLRDLVARAASWAKKIAARLRRLMRSRKGARFVAVRPPAIVGVALALARAPCGADTS